VKRSGVGFLEQLLIIKDLGTRSLPVSIFTSKGFVDHVFVATTYSIEKRNKRKAEQKKGGTKEAYVWHFSCERKSKA
jgi:hypothetical protein